MSTRQGKYNTYTLTPLQEAVLTGDKAKVRALSKIAHNGLNVSLEDKVKKTPVSVGIMNRAKNTMAGYLIYDRIDIHDPDVYMTHLYDFILEDNTARGIADRMLQVSTPVARSGKILYDSLVKIMNPEVATSLQSMHDTMVYIKAYLLQKGAKAKTSFGFLAFSGNSENRSRQTVRQMNRNRPSTVGGSRGRNARKSRKGRN